MYPRITELPVGDDLCWYADDDCLDHADTLGEWIRSAEERFVDVTAGTVIRVANKEFPSAFQFVPGYEHMIDSIGFTASGAMIRVPSELIAWGESLRADVRTNDHFTSDAVFTVQRKRRGVGIDLDYCEGYIWISDDMSRTKKGRKAPGYEYWSARPFNICGQTPGKFAKHRTHKAERQQAKAVVKTEVDRDQRES